MQKILKFTPAFALDFIYFFGIPPTSSVFVLSSLGPAQQILAVMVVLPPHCPLGGLHKKYKIFSPCLLSWRTTQKCKNLNVFRLKKQGLNLFLILIQIAHSFLNDITFQLYSHGVWNTTMLSSFCSFWK